MSASIASSAFLVIALGACILLTAWLPLVLRNLPLSLPIVAIGLGYFAAPSAWLERARAVLLSGHVLQHFTEFIILIALMGAGLRIKRPFSWSKWQATWRLLLIAMPLSIAAITILLHGLLGLKWASALLIGAALAPTDPVLAADVQVGPPGQEEGGEARFHLTAEAGFNDGLAFPFILLALMLAGGPHAPSLQQWVFFDLIWKVASGALIGYLSGRAFGWLTFRLPRLKLSKTGDGLIAVGVTLISYGLTELAHGNGFIAVFISAIALRASDRGHGFHSAMAEFSEQIERVLMVSLLAIFGGAIAGGILRPLGWYDILAVLIILLIIRPVSGWLSLLGAPLPAGARALIAFFGIRGLATFYYLAFATGQADFDEAPHIWAIGAATVLISVVLHGITSTPLMNWADRRRKREKSAAPEDAA